MTGRVLLLGALHALIFIAGVGVGIAVEHRSVYGCAQ